MQLQWSLFGKNIKYFSEVDWLPGTRAAAMATPRVLFLTSKDT
jgi:hypothetical protein